MGDSTYDAELRLQTLAKAMGMALPDAVFTIVLHNRWTQSGRRDPVALSELAALGTAQELDVWRARSQTLCNDAYVVGEALLFRKEVYPDRRVAFERDHPGFSETTYAKAVSFGCFQAR